MQGYQVYLKVRKNDGQELKADYSITYSSWQDRSKNSPEQVSTAKAIQKFFQEHTLDVGEILEVVSVYPLNAKATKELELNERLESAQHSLGMAQWVGDDEMEYSAHEAIDNIKKEMEAVK